MGERRGVGARSRAGGDDHGAERAQEQRGDDGRAGAGHGENHGEEREEGVGRLNAFSVSQSPILLKACPILRNNLSLFSDQNSEKTSTPMFPFFFSITWTR